MIAEERRHKEQELGKQYTTVPSTIFLDRGLAPLESITEYLKEQKGLSYHEIAVLVGRDDRTIWTCYNRAKKKRIASPGQYTDIGNAVDIPIEIFRDRKFAPLERITSHLKDAASMSFHEIAVLLNRDDRTIWTCYHRSQKKTMPN